MYSFIRIDGWINEKAPGPLQADVGARRPITEPPPTPPRAERADRLRAVHGDPDPPVHGEPAPEGARRRPMAHLPQRGHEPPLLDARERSRSGRALAVAPGPEG